MMRARLGQNFLISKQIASRMASVADADPKDIILEIGPGKGILTEELLKTGAKVVAVEKDPTLVDFLSKKFEKETASGQLKVVHADIRDFLKREVRSERRKINKVVANIPYYLTGQLLRFLLAQTKFRPSLIVLMLQKEVAERILAQTKFRPKSHKMSLLAVSVKVFAEPKIAFYVKGGNFRPQPKVDSAVVIFKKHKKDFFCGYKVDQNAFFKVVKSGFAHPRKLLKNNLLRHQVSRWFEKCGVKENARAEDLSLENWACLAKNL